MPPDLFIGLVTHPRSRFSDATSDGGVLKSLERMLAAQGLNVETGVSDQDAYSPALLPLGRAEVVSSIRAELACEQRWRAYVAGTAPGLKLRAFMTGRRAWRTMRLAPPWRRRPPIDEPGPRMVRRLVNIELSHLAIMKAAIRSVARWSLIIEDDASAQDAAKFAAELIEFIKAADDRGQPLTMNLSESFTPAQLGLEHLLSPVLAWPGAGAWATFSAQRPVTNTVCAVLYRGDYLQRLLVELEAIPLAPVIPIDFKVNEAVMRLAPAMLPGDCWVASPAPLTQRSGVPALRLEHLS